MPTHHPSPTHPHAPALLQEWGGVVGDSLSAAGRKLDADLSRMGKSVSEATGELGSSLAGAAAAGG